MGLTPTLPFPMAQISVWLLAGAMLCSIPAGSLEGDTIWIQREDNLRVFNHLRQLQRTPLYLCLGDRKNFKFPWSRKTIPQMHKTQRTCLNYEMLLQMFTLFSGQRSLAEWDDTLLSQLLSSLHKSLEHLEQLEHLEHLEERDGENRACSQVGILVRKYFQEIHSYLRGNNYIACAWEVVRVEMIIRIATMYQ